MICCNLYNLRTIIFTNFVKKNSILNHQNVSHGIHFHFFLFESFIFFTFEFDFISLLLVHNNWSLHHLLWVTKRYLSPLFGKSLSSWGVMQKNWIFRANFIFSKKKFNLPLWYAWYFIVQVLYYQFDVWNKPNHQKLTLLHYIEDCVFFMIFRAKMALFNNVPVHLIWHGSKTTFAMHLKLHTLISFGVWVILS